MALSRACSARRRLRTGNLFLPRTREQTRGPREHLQRFQADSHAKVRTRNHHSLGPSLGRVGKPRAGDAVGVWVGQGSPRGSEEEPGSCRRCRDQAWG